MRLSSGLGLLTMMATTEGCCVSIMAGDLKGMPVLDVRKLSAKQIADLSKLYDDLANDGFERLPAMVNCPTSTKLDDGLAEILDLPDQLPSAAFRRLNWLSRISGCRSILPESSV